MTQKPTPYTMDEKDDAIDRVIAGLRKGIPAAVTCRESNMPTDRTIRDWADADPDLASAIARAREDGWDQIAYDGLTIVDGLDEDPASRRVRSDYRLKLLAKWDPKRYGDRLTHSNDPEAPMPTVINFTLLDGPTKMLPGPDGD